MVTETVNRDRLISINHLTRLRNVLLREQESAHGRFLRHRTELPNLAAHYQGEETAYGVAVAMLDGTLRGIASVPEDPMLPRNGIDQYQAESR